MMLRERLFRERAANRRESETFGDKDLTRERRLFPGSRRAAAADLISTSKYKSSMFCNLAFIVLFCPTKNIVLSYFILHNHTNLSYVVTFLVFVILS